MEKKLNKKLQLNKEVIAKLNDINGGQRVTAGCTDGCTGSSMALCTLWNCTKADCTADCCTGACDTKAFCTMSEAPITVNP
jgi:hypothetical protein